MLNTIRHLPAAAVLLTLFLSMTASPATAADAGFALHEQPGQHLDVSFDGRVVARYMTAFDPQRLDDTAKPYLHVMDAAGKQPITKGLGGQYPHHRGIFAGFSRLTVDGKTHNLWGTTNVQAHQRFVNQQAAADQASFTSLVVWSTKDGQRLIEEERTFVFRAVEAPALVCVEVSSKLTALAGDTELGGDPEHAGVHYRPADELDRTQTRYLFPAEGNDPRRDKDLPWVGLSYVLGDQKYGVVQMNHPQNPRESTWSAYRDYGRFGNFAKAELARGQSLVLRYQFYITAGELPARESIQQRYDRYAS